MGMARMEADACRAWQLLMRFFFVQRGHLPTWGAPFGLSPIQCHVLHLLEPGQPMPMSRLADALSCDASNVTGLIDRLESRGLVQRRQATGDRRVKGTGPHRHRATAACRVAPPDDRAAASPISFDAARATSVGENPRSPLRGIDRLKRSRGYTAWRVTQRPAGNGSRTDPPVCVPPRDKGLPPCRANFL